MIFQRFNDLKVEMSNEMIRPVTENEVKIVDHVQNEDIPARIRVCGKLGPSVSMRAFLCTFLCLETKFSTTFVRSLATKVCAMWTDQQHPIGMVDCIGRRMASAGTILLICALMDKMQALERLLAWTFGNGIMLESSCVSFSEWNMLCTSRYAAESLQSSWKWTLLKWSGVGRGV